jgi:protein O-GlcNAc transferase
VSDEWIENVQCLHEAKDFLLLGDFDQAEAEYKKILRRTPDEGRAHYGLAKVFVERGEFELGIQSLGKACHEEPRNFQYLVFLGDLQKKQGNYKDAAEALQKAVELKPPIGLDEIYHLLAEVQTADNDSASALKTLKRSIEIESNSEVLYHMLGQVLRELKRPLEAMKAFRKALEISPFYFYSQNALAMELFCYGDNEEAVKQYSESLNLSPENLIARWGVELFLPFLQDTEEGVIQTKERWIKNVKALNAELTLDSAKEKKIAIEALLFHADFLLGYLGGNILPQRKLYAELVQRIVSSKFPEHTKPKTLKPRKGRLRIGFVSPFLHWHSIYKTHGGFITKLNREKFEVFTFYPGRILDSAIDDIKAHSDHFFQLDPALSISEMLSPILESDLDAMYFIDIGMAPIMQVLAAMRLAPIQMTGSGHPITSGMTTIDLFVSSDYMEPADAEEQYSEELLRLPHLGVSYPYPPIETISLAEHCKTEFAGPKYLILQSLFKILPQRDRVYAEIASRVPGASFHFIAPEGKGALKEQFQKRLARAFEEKGLNAEAYCHFHPWMKQEEFFGFLQFGDVILDTMDWSGFNTSMEASAMAKPIVTLPGSTMRSRHSYGINLRLDMPELIAADEKDYIEIASRLGKDRDFRRDCAEKIQQRHKKLFDDEAPIRAFEEYLCHIRKN